MQVSQIEVFILTAAASSCEQQELIINSKFLARIESAQRSQLMPARVSRERASLESSSSAFTMRAKFDHTRSQPATSRGSRSESAIRVCMVCHVPDMNPRCVHPDVYTSEEPIGVRTYGDLRSVS